MSRRLYFFLILVAFYACKKENDRPQWDINVVGPVLYATLGLDKLTGDTLITALPGGEQVINYDSVFSDFDLDSIYKVSDTTITTLSFFPPFPSMISPGFQFTSNNNNISLGIANVQLKNAIVQSGKIRLEIKNTLRSKIIFTYKIPKATKNGIPFEVTASVDSADTSSPKYFINEYDFSGYHLDLTGLSGNAYNSISYNVVSVADPQGYPFPVFGSDTIVNLKTTLLGIRPSYAEGYLGQADNEAVSQKNLGLGYMVKEGLMDLDSIRLNLDINNYIGADEQVYISYMRSTNYLTGNVVDLTAPSIINHALNINRGTQTGVVSDPVNPSHYLIELNNSNSNLTQLIENFPDKLEYDLRMKLNPLGNISGSNDFVYSDYLVKVRFNLQMPLRFALNQLTLADTVDFNISNATNFDALGYTNLKLIAENGFPFDMNMQMFLIDSNQSIVDSLFVPDLIRSAPYDVSYRASGTSETIIEIPVDADRKQRLLSVQRIGLRLKFNTPDYPQMMQMYSDYRLKLKIVADGVYSIH